MAEEREGLVKEVFQAAMEEDPEERADFVASACGGDEAARVRVMDLLEAYERADGFLTSPTRNAATERRDSPAAGYEGKTIGRYKVLQLIGEGGFGAVYMAEQEEPIRRRVALKVIKLGMDTKQVIARFEAERQALAMMEHPNIARVLDAGATETGRPYFVMELVRGIPITDYCDQNCLGTRERLDLFAEVCGAVQHAHQKGVIHRDIKPSNVLVTLHDGRPVPKVIDFGVARATHQRLTERTLFTEFGQFIGTPAYMSPEQASMSGLDIDTRSDIYSLGVLLYELLTGTTPLTDGQLRHIARVEILRALGEIEPPRPSTRISQLGETAATVAKLRGSEPGALERLLRGDLDWIVMKALEKDRARRYGSASELSEDIRRYFGGDPVSAGPPGVGYRFRKLVRKNRGKVGAAAAVLVALLFGGMTATWQGVEMQRQGQRARASSIVASAMAAQDPVLKALLIEELADLADVPGRLAVLRDALNQPLPERIVRTSERHNNLTYSDDGRHLAATLVDGTVRVWRTDDAESPAVLRAQAGRANGVGFSPNGARLVVGYDDGSVRIWNSDGTGSPTLLGRHGGPVWGSHFSAGGDRVITRSADEIRVWPAGGGEPVLLRAEGVRLGNAELDRDGGRVLAGGSDGAARIWPADGSGPPLVLVGHEGSVWAEFSHGGTRVVTASDDGAVRIWPADGSAEPLVLPHPGWVYWQVNFSDDDAVLVTGSTDGTARVWDLEGTGEPIVLPHSAPVLDSKPTPDGSRVLTAAADGIIRLWRPGGQLTPVTFAGPPGPVGLRRTASDLVGAFSDGTLRTWSLDATGEATVLRHEGRVCDAVFSPDGSRIATASDDGIVRVWPSRATSAPILLRGHRSTVCRSSFGPGGTRLVTASRDSTARIWRLGDAGEPVVLRHPDGVYAAAFSPDGERVVTGSMDGGVRLWEADGRGDPEVLHLHDGPVYDVAFAPEGSRVLSASADGTARITGLGDRGDPVVFRALGSVYTAAFSPDGERVVTGSEDGDLRIWTADGRGAPGYLVGHQRTVHRAAFSPDGDRIVSASADGTARVWRVDGLETPLVLRGHEDRLWTAAFSPDGRRVLTASRDGTARVWRVTWEDLLDYARENVRACLTAEQRVRLLGESTRVAESATEACELDLAARVR